MAHVGSARYEGDTWDLASSVGATATMVAAARAMATRAERPLINDPYAEPLVRAVGVELLTLVASGELDPADVGDDAEASLSRMSDNMAARTKFFDDFFLEATGSGITQAVILASGLDDPGLPPFVAGRDCGLRGRPGAGHRIQVPPRWPNSVSNPPSYAVRWPWICVTTGRPPTCGRFPSGPADGMER